MFEGRRCGGPGPCLAVFSACMSSSNEWQGKGTTKGGRRCAKKSQQISEAEDSSAYLMPLAQVLEHLEL